MQQQKGSESGSEIEVTWEDQLNINKFGRLNNRFHELEDEIKFAKESNDSLEDASNELILSDEDIVRFQIGEVFAHTPREEAEGRLEKMKEVAGKRLEELEEEKGSVLAQMAELKKVLYGLPQIRVRGNIRCSSETTTTPNKKANTSLAAAAAVTGMIGATGPALALVDERMSTEGTGLSLGVSNNLLGWILLGVFGLIWALFFLYTTTLEEDEESGLSL